MAAEKSACKLPPTKNSILVLDQPAHADSSKTTTNTSKKKIVAAPKKKSRAKRPSFSTAGPAVEKDAAGAVQEEATLAIEEDAAPAVQEEHVSSEEQPAIPPVHKSQRIMNQFKKPSKGKGNGGLITID